MVNILLCCNEGMSTSFLVKKMQEVADKNSLKVKIWAVSEPRVDTESEEADVVMLGPQIAFLEGKIQERLNNRVPVEAISAEDFGRINGAAVLKRALTLVKNHRAANA
ncbi:PTS system, cellobiose-specific IIB component [Pilibacter termitis]|uniref:PTS system, cellobiose-specific IIB component n=1 Tax=Pilibacter termitis TaxID=263852 RepID=A0A1T4LMT3_9ENTE|nr:PTS sugar transporter subunit IIB [Pilibacter termitis]SJZ56049.1 PTS system, cellobiose-specific IIB component [Pilibacter termitis]